MGIDNAPWYCAPIGPRNFADYRGDFIPQFTEVEPWVKNCTPLGQNCASTKCCAWSGYKCYEKNATWASCLSSCHPKKWNGGVSEVPLVQKGKPLANPPAHWNVSFTPASPGPWTCKRLAPAAKPGKLNGTALFCFSVAISDTGGKKKSEDVQLLLQAQKLKTHVFACERWMVFSKLLAHMEDCQVRLPIHNGDHAHFREYGEDKFAAWCMHLEGVDKIPSRQQVDSLPEDTMIQGLHITVSCPGHRTKFERTMKKWHPNCTNTKSAGLHAFRKPTLWAKCFRETMMLG